MFRQFQVRVFCVRSEIGKHETYRLYGKISWFELVGFMSLINCYTLIGIEYELISWEPQ